MASPPILEFKPIQTKVASQTYGGDLSRARVPGGWLVMYRTYGALVFVPDANHAWDGGSLPEPATQGK